MRSSYFYGIGYLSVGHILSKKASFAISCRGWTTRSRTYVDAGVVEACHSLRNLEIGCGVGNRPKNLVDALVAPSVMTFHRRVASKIYAIFYGGLEPIGYFLAALCLYSNA